MKQRALSRRQFWQTTAIGSVAVAAFEVPAICSSKSPNAKLNLAFVGKLDVLYVNCQEYAVYPVEKFQKAFKPAAWIPRPKNHYLEFLNACKANDPSLTKCPFSYGGRLTESILLGTISYRTGKKLTWDADNLCTDVPRQMR